MADERLRRRVGLLCDGLFKIFPAAAAALPSPLQVFEALTDRRVEGKSVSAEISVPSVAALLAALRVSERPCGLKGPPPQESADSAVGGGGASEDFDAHALLPHAVGNFPPSSEACSLLAGSAEGPAVEFAEIDWGCAVGEELPSNLKESPSASAEASPRAPPLSLLVNQLAPARLAAPLLLLLARRCPVRRFFEEASEDGENSGGEGAEADEGEADEAAAPLFLSEASSEAAGSVEFSSEGPSPVPVVPGLGSRLLTSQDGLGALLSCVVRCVACLEAARLAQNSKSAPWGVPRALRGKGGAEVATGKNASEGVEAASPERLLEFEQENAFLVLPLLNLVLRLLRLCIERLGLAAGERPQEAAEALEETYGLFWLGLRRTALQQVLVVVVAELLQHRRLQTERRLVVEQSLAAEEARIASAKKKGHGNGNAAAAEARRLWRLLMVQEGLGDEVKTACVSSESESDEALQLLL